MKLNELFTDDDAVSPVIGVILMVAITVILAAVIGTFVLGLGEQVQSNAPSADFSFDQNGTDHLDITHTSGQAIEVANLNVTGPSATTDPQCGNASSWGDNTEVGAGDTCTYHAGGSNEGTVRVIWSSDDESNSATLAEYDWG